MVYLTPDISVWDPYDENYAEREAKSVDFREDLMENEPKDRKIINDSDICELQVPEERFEADIRSIVANNDISMFQSDETYDDCANPQDGEIDFNRHDDVMQARIADLTACYDDGLLCRMLN